MRINDEDNKRQMITEISNQKDAQQEEFALSQESGIDASRICDSRSKRIVDPTLGPRGYRSNQSSDKLHVRGDSKQQQNVKGHPVAIASKRKVLFKNGKRIKRSRLPA